MNDTSHFEVKASSNNNTNDKNSQVDLHFRHVKENNITEIVTKSVCEGIQQADYVKKLNEVNIYRKTVMNEVLEVSENNGFAANRSETWLSENFDRVFGYQNKGIPAELRDGQRILQVTLDKNKYQPFRDDLIPQFRSKGRGKSIFNYEGIAGGAPRPYEATVPSTVDRNIGVKKDDIDQFNETIKSISVLDPESPFVKNKFLRYLSQNKLKVSMIAISVVYEIHQLIVILMDKNGETLDRLVIHTLNVAVNQLGSYIISALTCLLPGIAAFVIGVLGGLVLGFIGKKIGELLFGLHPRVAPGEGPPISDYFSFIYGTNNCFGEPLNDYNLAEVLGIPKSDYSVDANKIACQAPTNNYEDRFIQTARGAPK
mgnify:FL=1